MLKRLGKLIDQIPVKWSYAFMLPSGLLVMGLTVVWPNELKESIMDGGVGENIAALTPGALLCYGLWITEICITGLFDLESFWEQLAAEIKELLGGQEPDAE